MRFSKAFLAAGWLPLASGDPAVNAGSALAVCLFRPEGVTRALPMVRMRIGARVTVLEIRAHGTPTGRCSRGHWLRLDDSETPGTAAAWGKLAKFWAWRILQAHDSASPTRWNWATDPGKDPNLCRTSATANVAHPTLVGAQGRGRVGCSLPNQTGVMGYTPASGRKAGTHDEARISAAVAESQDTRAAAFRYDREETTRIAGMRAALARRMGK